MQKVLVFEFSFFLKDEGNTVYSSFFFKKNRYIKQNRRRTIPPATHSVVEWRRVEKCTVGARFWPPVPSLFLGAPSRRTVENRGKSFDFKGGEGEEAAAAATPVGTGGGGGEAGFKAAEDWRRRRGREEGENKSPCVSESEEEGDR